MENRVGQKIEKNWVAYANFFDHVLLTHATIEVLADIVGVLYTCHEFTF